MILIEQYDVLEKPLNQTFDKCKGNGSTLFVRRIDVVAFIAVRMGKKRAEVRCNGTGKTIKKKYWNQETHAEAEALLAEHKVSKIGFILFSLICIGLIASIFYLVTQNFSSSQAYEESFIAKSNAEKKEILSQLGENDLILVSNEVYRIMRLDNEKVWLEKSTANISAEDFNSFKPMDASLVPDDSFEGSYEIDRQSFLNNIISINKNASTMITNYLDR